MTDMRNRLKFLEDLLRREGQATHADTIAAALAEIEERHHEDKDGLCPDCWKHYPCNMVKLARALAKFGDTPDEDGDRSVERTLAEVSS